MKKHLRRLMSLEPKLLLGFLLAAVLLWSFVGIADNVQEGDTLSWDNRLLLAFREPGNLAVTIGPPRLLKVMQDLTSLGGVSVLTVMIAIIAGYLAVSRRIAMALFLVAATLGGSFAGTFLKDLFLRPRPDVVPHLVKVETLSFPSGHALNSAVIYLTLGALLARAESRRSVKIYILGVAIFLTLLIGFSRVFLGVHYPSDVLAGWCAGAVWATGCAILARRLQRDDKIEQPSHAVEEEARKGAQPSGQ